MSLQTSMHIQHSAIDPHLPQISTHNLLRPIQRKRHRALSLEKPVCVKSVCG